MKKKNEGKLALAIAIIQHPAVQQAAKKIGQAGLRKAQKWWDARAARKKGKRQANAKRKNILPSEKPLKAKARPRTKKK